MFEKIPSEIKIVEVAPRDGLQNEKAILSTQDKFEFIKKLTLAGLHHIEVTSFVKPTAIPQMTDATELFEMVSSELDRTQFHFSALVPNMVGYEKAQKFLVQEIALFTATSDTFNKKNINATVDESFERLKQVAAQAKKEGVKVRAYISTAFGCPYEGEIPQKKLVSIYKKCLELGADEIAVSDTTGVATPLQVSKLLDTLEINFGLEKVALHFHDTRGMAISNILVSLDHGIKVFDSAAGGLGGCPYAKGATGNVATEDLIYLLESLGVKTGVNMELLAQASQFVFDKIGRQSTSKYLLAYLNSKK